jgi:hypothetical protein
MSWFAWLVLAVLGALVIVWAVRYRRLGLSAVPRAVGRDFLDLLKWIKNWWSVAAIIVALVCCLLLAINLFADADAFLSANADRPLLVGAVTYLPLVILILVILAGRLRVSRLTPSLSGRLVRYGAIAVVSLWLLFVLPYVAVSNHFTTTSPDWKFWLQTVAGNWSPDSFPPLSAQPAEEQKTSSVSSANLSTSAKYQFTFSAIIAVLLNNALYLIIVTLLWRFTEARERIRKMLLRQAFDAFELASRNEMLRKFVGPTATSADVARANSLILEGLANARKEAVNIISATLGPEEARALEMAQNLELPRGVAAE